VSERQSTAALIKRALDEAPSLQEGLKLTLILAMAGQAVTVVTPIVLQQILDEEILSPSGVDMNGVFIRAGIALAALVIGLIVGRASLMRLINSSSTGLSDLRTKTFGHIMSQSVLHVQSERRGNLLSRVTSDITTLQDFMEWGGVGMIIASSQVLLATSVMMYYEWRLALVALVGVLIYLVMMRWFQRILSRNYDEVRREVGASLGYSASRSPQSPSSVPTALRRALSPRWPPPWSAGSRSSSEPLGSEISSSPLRRCSPDCSPRSWSSLESSSGCNWVPRREPWSPFSC
jgi:ABC-type multidrug transport system fused ATPase/permease subunit